MARKKPVSKLSVVTGVSEITIPVDKDKTYAVSNELYPFKETDGYNSNVNRIMEWDKDKLIEECADIEEQNKVKLKDIEESNIGINAMTKDLDEVKKLRQWKQVKDNWKVYSKVYGGIVKETKLIQETQKRDQLKEKIKYETRILNNYKEVLEAMDETN